MRDDEFLTVAEIAETLKVNPQTVGNWIDRGELSAVRVGTRRVRVRQSEFDRFISAGGETETTTDEPTAEASAIVDLEHDQFVGVLAEILTRAANSDPEDMAAALRELAAAAQTLADALDQPADSE